MNRDLLTVREGIENPLHFWLAAPAFNHEVEGVGALVSAPVASEDIRMYRKILPHLWWLIVDGKGETPVPTLANNIHIIRTTHLCLLCGTDDVDKLNTIFYKLVSGDFVEVS